MVWVSPYAVRRTLMTGRIIPTLPEPMTTHPYEDITDHEEKDEIYKEWVCDVVADLECPRPRHGASDPFTGSSSGSQNLLLSLLSVGWCFLKQSLQ